jgi:hypothetical protein
MPELSAPVQVSRFRPVTQLIHEFDLLEFRKQRNFVTFPEQQFPRLWERKKSTALADLPGILLLSAKSYKMVT